MDDRINTYRLKQTMRAERLEARAERLERAAAQASDAAHRAVAAIPMGQPILIGHHSEGRHRRDLARHDRAMRRAIELKRQAGEARAAAANVGTAGISADDPDAVAQLEAKLARLERAQVQMREANKVVRKWRKRGVTGADGEGFDKYHRELLERVDANFPRSTAKALMRPDFAGRYGYADFELSNNGAEIRRCKKRLEELRAKAAERAAAGDDAVAVREVKGVRVEEDLDENRLRLVFAAKPAAELRAELKRAGFRWAPSAGAWQRQLNNAARHAAERVLAKL